MLGHGNGMDLRRDAKLFKKTDGFTIIRSSCSDALLWGHDCSDALTHPKNLSCSTKDPAGLNFRSLVHSGARSTLSRCLHCIRKMQAEEFLETGVHTNAKRQALRCTGWLGAGAVKASPPAVPYLRNTGMQL